MKKTVIEIIAFLILLFIWGCNNNTNTPIPQKIEIIPLKLGNYWIYKHGNSFDTIQVIGEEYAKSEKCYVVLIGNMTWTHNNREDGYYSIYYVPPSLDQYYLIFKYPGKPDDWYFGYYGQTKIASISEIVSIQLGKFKCYKYSSETNNERGDETWYFHYVSPGVGVIIEEIYFKKYDDSISTLESRKELIKYKLN